MDLGKSRIPGLVAPKKISTKKEEVSRSPLVPSEKNNAAASGGRKIRTKEISSKYKSSPAAPQRCPSPSASSATSVGGPTLPKRAQSAERTRPSTPLSRNSAPSSPSSRPSKPSSSPSPSRPSTPVHDSAVDLRTSARRVIAPRTVDGLWPSMRSLSSSFQSESVSAPTLRREKPIGNTNSAVDRTSKSSTNGSSERKRTPLRGRNVSEQSENSKAVGSSHSSVVDQHRWPGIAGAKLSANAMTRSMDFTSLPAPSRGVSPRRTAVTETPGRLLLKSVSDGTRRMSLDAVTPSPSVPSNVRPRSSSLTRSSRTQSLPVPGAQRSPSPSKVPTSRSMASPSRSRHSTPFSSSSSLSGRISSSSPALSYIIDVRKGKKNENDIEHAHQLRLLYNRYLQWRLVNARAETALFIQKIVAEEDIYSTWNAISELHDYVAAKRINIQQLKNDLKLNMVLKEQMMYLEDWSSLERQHSGSLAGTTEALRASIINLPVSSDARAHNQAIERSIHSSLDVMQAISSSVYSLLPLVEGTNSMISELAYMAANERAMLDQCRELLASVAAIQVQEGSLRTQVLQLHQDMLTRTG